MLHKIFGCLLVLCVSLFAANISANPQDVLEKVCIARGTIKTNTPSDYYSPGIIKATKLLTNYYYILGNNQEFRCIDVAKGSCYARPVEFQQNPEGEFTILRKTGTKMNSTACSAVLYQIGVRSQAELALCKNCGS